MIFRIAALTATAAVLVIGTTAFAVRTTARPAAGRQVPTQRVSSRPFPHPMIRTRLPAALFAANADSKIKTVGTINWAGYAVTRSRVTFRRVTATFFVPYLSCARTPDTFSSHWVGFDGFSSATVEQDGIEADCAGSRATYGAWYETFPHPEVLSRIVIRPGNSITATVSYSSRRRDYEMQLTDNTNGHHFTVFQKCAASACKRSSAEVISEAPEVGTQQASLADYGAESFASISITSGGGKTGGISARHWSATKIIQIGNDSNTFIARPTSLHGASFDNYWLGEN
jgi:hypothetical protein